jgi:hypothetical protein
MRQCYEGIPPITRADSGASATCATAFGLLLRSVAARNRISGFGTKRPIADEPSRSALRCEADRVIRGPRMMVDDPFRTFELDPAGAAFEPGE